MKQPYRAMFWTLLPYAVWTVWACLWWAQSGPTDDHSAGMTRLAPLAVTTLLGLPFSLLGGLLGWALGVHSDNGLFACLLLGGWAQYMTMGWFIGRGIVRRRVLESLHGPTMPGDPPNANVHEKSEKSSPPGQSSPV